MMPNNSSIYITKPVVNVQVLINSLLGSFPISRARTGQRFQLMKDNQKMCFFLAQGFCNAKRNRDSLIVARIRAPGAVGLNLFAPDISILFIQAGNDVEYLYLPLDTVLQHIEEHNLWKDVSYLLMYYAAEFQVYLQTNTSVPTYELVCNHLWVLSQETFEVRATTPAAQFILDRTTLSRSSVMKILSELVRGGHIVVNRGLLIEIKNLPQSY